MPDNPSPEQHFQRLARLIALEAEAEKQEDCAPCNACLLAVARGRGNCLVNLVIRAEDAAWAAASC